ncbi:MAG: hypothetical protein JRI23_15265 [Deltaproteobacteria bacterium]|nr:hypothetical protein [Deltaproteobacteria bacterium]MBW2533108.1 hypothetical protein [Deltaproteobacteria bacterium]
MPIAALLIAAGCESIAGLDDFQDAPDGGTANGTATATGSGSGGAATGSGGGSAGGTSTGTSTGVGGAGGGGVALVDEGVVVRYFLDEAASGVSPAAALDSTQVPFDLTNTYGGTTPTAPMTYGEIQGNRGLQWSQANTVGVASSSLTLPNKIAKTLHGSTTATLEVVMQVTAAGSANTLFRNLRAAGLARLALGLNSAGSFFVEWNGGQNIGTWTFDLPTSGRAFVHLVIDTALSNGPERIQLFVDGTSLPMYGSTGQLTQNATFELLGLSDLALALGNWADGQAHSYQGALQYVALYSEAFTMEQIDQNVAALTASDDAP